MHKAMLRGVSRGPFLTEGGVAITTGRRRALTGASSSPSSRQEAIRGDDIAYSALCAGLWANVRRNSGGPPPMSDLTDPIIILSNLDCSMREGIAALAERAVDETLRAIAGRVDDVGLGK